MSCSTCGVRLPGVHADERGAEAEARARGWLITRGNGTWRPDVDLCPICRKKAGDA